MTTRLQTISPDHLEGDLEGHDYRMSPAQARRTIEAGIIPEADSVELLDGFLARRDGGHYRLGVDQYRAMAERGILTTDDRIELLEGWLVAKMAKYPPHTISKNLTRDALATIVPADWFVATEDPVRSFDSEPEPDVSIVHGTIRDYRDRTPGPKEVALVVEVADSSLSKDRSRKKQLYARAGFVVYWIINLIDRQIEVDLDPTGPATRPDYLRRQDYGLDALIPVVIAGQEVGHLAVRDLLS